MPQPLNALATSPPEPDSPYVRFRDGVLRVVVDGEFTKWHCLHVGDDRWSISPAGHRCSKPFVVRLPDDVGEPPVIVTPQYIGSRRRMIVAAALRFALSLE